MNDYEKINELLARGKYRKVAAEADKALSAVGSQGMNGVFERFSFLTGDAYTYFVTAYPDRQITWIKNVAAIMYAKAYALNELRDYEGAAAVLTQAVLWDPVSPKLAFELCSAYIRLKRFDEAKAAIARVPEYIMNVHDAAVYYCKVAYLYSQNGDYINSTSCLLYSFAFEDTRAACKELEYIACETAQSVPEITEESIAAAAKRLHEQGLDFTLSVTAKAALESLRLLYEKGADEERCRYYTQTLHRLAPEAISRIRDYI